MNRESVGVHIWGVLGVGILVLLLYLFKVETLNTFSALSFGAFYLIAVATIVITGLTHKHPNRMLFGNLVLAMMMLKLIITPFIIIWYIKTNDAISRWILLPFFFSYLWFTIYEMRYLLKKGEDI